MRGLIRKQPLIVIAAVAIIGMVAIGLLQFFKQGDESQSEPTTTFTQTPVLASDEVLVIEKGLSGSNTESLRPLLAPDLSLAKIALDDSGGGKQVKLDVSSIKRLPDNFISVEYYDIDNQASRATLFLLKVGEKWLIAGGIS